MKGSYCRGPKREGAARNGISVQQRKFRFFVFPLHAGFTVLTEPFTPRSSKCKGKGKVHPVTNCEAQQEMEV